MQNKLNKNNAFNSLGSSFEEFTASPPDRVWDAVELDLAKKKLEKDKKRFFWVQLMSIGIAISSALFGIYGLGNHTKILSDNSSAKKQLTEIKETINIKNRAPEIIKQKEISNTLTDTRKKSDKDEKIPTNKNLNEKIGTPAHIQTNSGKTSHKNLTVSSAINPDAKSLSEKNITESNIYISTSRLAHENLSKIMGSTNNDTDLTQNNNTNENKTNTLNQSVSKNTNLKNNEVVNASSENEVAKDEPDSSASQHSDSSIAAESTFTPDTINQINNTLPQAQPNNALSRLSIMAFLSPAYSSRVLIDGNTGSSDLSEFNKEETPLIAFTSGIKFGYDVSDKWNIQLGATYSYIEQKSNPANLNIDSSSTDNIRYSYASSSGIVNFSSSDFKSDEAGLLPKGKVFSSFSAKEKIQFINVPVLVRYRLLNNKISAYLIGGITANFMISKQVNLDVLNQPGALTVNTNKISGLRPVNGGFLLGMEYHYNLTKGLGVLLAPMVAGSFTPINKNTPVNSYPFSLSLAVGLIYHF